MDFMKMLAPGGFSPQSMLTGVGMPGGPGSLGGPAIPPQLMNQIMPGSSPEMATNGGSQSGLMAMIQALRGGGIGPSGFGR
jgi:hypothetical protein